MITHVPWATRASIADLTLVPFGNIAFDTGPSPPPHTAVQPPSTRNASVIPLRPAVFALAATCEPTPGLISAYGTKRALPGGGGGGGGGGGPPSSISILSDDRRSLKLIPAAVKQAVSPAVSVTCAPVCWLPSN